MQKRKSGNPQETAGAIKERLSQTPDFELPSFIESYENDSRSGVIKLVETARRRYEKLQRGDCAHRVVKEIRKRVR